MLRVIGSVEKPTDDLSAQATGSIAPLAKPREVNTPELNQLSEALQIADPEEIQKQLKAVKDHLNSSVFLDLENRINDYNYARALEILKEQILCEAIPL